MQIFLIDDGEVFKCILTLGTSDLMYYRLHKYSDQFLINGDSNRRYEDNA